MPSMSLPRLASTRDVERWFVAVGGRFEDDSTDRTEIWATVIDPKMLLDISGAFCKVSRSEQLRYLTGLCL